MWYNFPIIVTFLNINFKPSFYFNAKERVLDKQKFTTLHLHSHHPRPLVVCPFAQHLQLTLLHSMLIAQLPLLSPSINIIWKCSLPHSISPISSLITMTITTHYSCLHLLLLSTISTILIFQTLAVVHLTQSHHPILRMMFRTNNNSINKSVKTSLPSHH